MLKTIPIGILLSPPHWSVSGKCESAKTTKSVFFLPEETRYPMV